MKTNIAALIKALVLTPAILLPGITAWAGEPPKLILQITVDALRGDLPGRFDNVLGEGGFRYLINTGIHYTNANYQHANTETIVDHASLATGSVPAAHGMVGNVWFDRELDRLVFNIEDSRYHQLTADADGRSPENILTSTFSDELAVHFAGKSKIFGVSVKDRGDVDSFQKTDDSCRNLSS